MTAVHKVNKTTEKRMSVNASRSSVSGKLLHLDMKAFATEISKDPEAALVFLKRAGIVTRTGKIAKAYGG